MSGFAVLDFETTGFSPRTGERVVEIGVVGLSAQGETEFEWETLVDPCKDPGYSTKVHGLTRRHLSSAPVFADILPEFVQALAGRTLVAHNYSFDSSFLASELCHAGLEVSTPELPGLCTLALSRRYMPGASKTLAACCEHHGIRIGNAHSALDDARAAARLLTIYRDRDDFEKTWGSAMLASASIPWPDVVPGVSASYPRSRLV